MLIQAVAWHHIYHAYIDICYMTHYLSCTWSWVAGSTPRTFGGRAMRDHCFGASLSSSSSLESLSPLDITLALNLSQDMENCETLVTVTQIPTIRTQVVQRRTQVWHWWSGDFLRTGRVVCVAKKSSLSQTCLASWIPFLLCSCISGPGRQKKGWLDCSAWIHSIWRGSQNIAMHLTKSKALQFS
jgi:hypothetical protein